MTKDCFTLKREAISLSRKLSKDPNNYAMRQIFSACRNMYNKMRKKLKATYFHSMVDKLNTLNPKLSKGFWTFFKDIED